MPSAALAAPGGDLRARVLHEDLTFRCRAKTCRVTASYVTDVDRAARARLEFVLPVNVQVGARMGTTPVPVSFTSAADHFDEYRRRLDLDPSHPDGSQPAPALYKAEAIVDFAAGRNEITFEYEQTLAATEEGYGYFHDGKMVRNLTYVLWPLAEWTRAPDFTIKLRVEVERAPPSWWKRTFGHPTNVRCGGLSGQRAQVGGQLVYTATIGSRFPDYLYCRIGDDDRVSD